MTKKKGWYSNEMNTWDLDKINSVLSQYGQEGLTQNTYAWLTNAARQKQAAEDAEIQALRAQQAAAPITAIHSEPTGLNVSTVAAPTTIKVSNQDAEQYLYNPEEDVYYAGTAAHVDINTKKKKATNKSATEFLNAYKDDPDMLFNPNYAETRKKISNKQWNQLLALHPEYFEKYHKYIPDKVLSNSVARSTREAMNEAAPYAAMAVTGAFNPFAAGAGFIGGLGTNEVVHAASDGKYDSWGQMTSDKLGIESKIGQNLMELTNPGALAFSAAGAAATGGISTVIRNGKTIRTPRYYKTTQSPYVRTVNGEVTGFDIIPEQRVLSTKSLMGGAEGGMIYDPHITVPEQRIPVYSKVTQYVKGHKAGDFYRMSTYNTDPYSQTYNSHTLGYATPFGDSQEIRIPTEHGGAAGRTFIPKVDFYQTVSDWGDPEFQKWWTQNAPGNDGKTLYYKGKPIKIAYDPNGMRTTNMHTSLDSGVHPLGSATGKLVLDRPAITYQGPAIGAGQIGVSEVRLVPGTVSTGETVTRKTGGILNYMDYIR